ncbi:hypothetical protein [Breznakia pachnodae]|uniref:SufBD protein n=1 Tax=Breznakia pachnodae TaxID=265178 RepID=A0ABU0E890_9FIRM|nr:hypothetical protein [Breznakia pachnodae]MDQ0363117.1 hypothetical protein [Breznakia pachnodae]
MEINNNVQELVAKLNQNDQMEAYHALKELLKISQDSIEVYNYLDTFRSFLRDEKNSYVRSRGFLLIVENARWDKANKINGFVSELLDAIEDEKPTATRQHIQSLSTLIKYKPEFQSLIEERLESIDYNKYADTMKGLVQKDVNNILKLTKE